MKLNLDGLKARAKKVNKTDTTEEFSSASAAASPSVPEQVSEETKRTLKLYKKVFEDWISSIQTEMNKENLPERFLTTQENIYKEIKTRINSIVDENLTPEDKLRITDAVYPVIEFIQKAIENKEKIKVIQVGAHVEIKKANEKFEHSLKIIQQSAEDIGMTINRIITRTGISAGKTAAVNELFEEITQEAIKKLDAEDEANQEIGEFLQPDLNKKDNSEIKRLRNKIATLTQEQSQVFINLALKEHSNIPLAFTILDSLDSKLRSDGTDNEYIEEIWREFLQNGLGVVYEIETRIKEQLFTPETIVRVLGEQNKDKLTLSDVDKFITAIQTELLTIKKADTDGFSEDEKNIFNAVKAELKKQFNSIKSNDPMLKAFEESADRLIRGRSPETLEAALKITKYNSNQPAYLHGKIDKALKIISQSTPREQTLKPDLLDEASDFGKEKELNFNQATELCFETQVLIAKLKIYNVDITYNNLVNEIFKDHFIISRNMTLSDIDLTSTTGKFKLDTAALIIEKAKEAIDPEENVEKIKEKIIKNLAALGVKAEIISESNLFKVREESVAKKNSPSAAPGVSLKRGGSFINRTDSSSPSDDDQPVMAPAPLFGTRVKRRESFSGTLDTKGLTRAENPQERNFSITGNNPLKQKAAGNNPNEIFFKEIDLSKIYSLDEYGNTLLHILCANEKAEPGNIVDTIHTLFKQMQDNGYKHHALGTDGVVYEINGDEAIFRFLDQKNTDGKTALHLLCENSYFKGTDLQTIISSLYYQGADLNIPDKEKLSPLQILCTRSGTLDAVKYVCGDDDILFGPIVEEAYSAQIDYQDISGTVRGLTPIYTAATGGLERGIGELLEVYNYLKTRGADTSICQDCNANLPSTVEEYIEGKLRLLGGSTIDEARKNGQEKFDTICDSIGDNRNIDSEEIIKNPDLLNFTKDGNTLLDIAIISGNQQATNLILEHHPEIEKYRREIILSKESYSAGGVSAAVSLAASSLVINIPKNSGEVVVATTASLATAALLGAAVWGVGRLGYECYHQYNNPDNANIGRNFEELRKKLSALEESTGMDENSLKLLSNIEASIIVTTKENSPDTVKMGENLLKSHLLRKSLFSNLDNEDLKQEIINKSKDLIDSFNEWKKIQQGRETSAGLKMFYDSLQVSAIGAAAGAALTTLTNNAPVGATAGVILGAAGAANKWVNIIKNRNNTGITK